MQTTLVRKGPHFFKRWGPVVFIAIVIFLVFFNTLDNDFVNYDDPELIHQNSDIKRISWENTKKIFSSVPFTEYYPLVMFSYALEYAIVGLDARVYHFTNLSLHILNSILFFWLIYLLSRSRAASIIGALLFGIHPLRQS